MHLPGYYTNIPPKVLQCSAWPCFRGASETGASLMCDSNCGQVLIQNYYPKAYAMIGIQCFKCGETSWTPQIPPGEVLSSSVLPLGSFGKFRLESTVNVPPGALLACEQEIRRAKELTAPRDAEIPLVFSKAGLAHIVERYDIISGKKFAVQRKMVTQSNGSCYKKLPFARAVSHIDQCLTNGRLDLRRPDTLTAIVWLRMFCKVVGLWEHHPRFAVVAQQLGKPDCFIHTSCGLIAAAYLHKAGNQIGLSLENKHGEANQDLYVRTGPDSNLFLEVKAPLALQWGATGIPKCGVVEKAVARSIQGSSHQINSMHRGILILGSSYISDAAPSILKSAIERGLARRGQRHKGLAAIVGLSPVIDLQACCTGTNEFLSFEISVTLNSHYDGANPVT
jgi:hypothetical protein